MNKEAIIRIIALGSFCTFGISACQVGHSNNSVQSEQERPISQDTLDEALNEAAFAGDTTKVRVLLDNGADVNEHEWFFRPLATASWQGHVAVVQMLLDHGADVEGVMIGRVTALLLAAKEGHPAVVRMLLAHGANVNHQIPPDMATYYICYNEGQEAARRVLLAPGGDVNQINPTLNYSLTVYGQSHGVVLDLGSTALYLASQSGHELVVKMLLANGADVHAKTSAGKTALNVAADSRIVQLLKAAGAK